jgi:CarD family transcriptional regulator, regulator of rRNA transcription
MMTFMIGEKVVYPNQGVATIENISTRSFGAQLEKFYLLRLIYGSMTVMVPFSNVTNVGLRKITKNQDVCRTLTFLASGHCPSPSDWKCRFKENSDKMQSGSLLQVAEVLKTLLLLQGDKPLSFREKKMLDRARHLLVSELSIARGLRETDAEAALDRALNKAGLSLPAVL